MADLTSLERSRLKAMLGMGPRDPKQHHGFRNYHASPTPADCAQFDTLIARGFVQRGAEYQAGAFFHVTRAGCEALGLDAEVIERVVGNAQA